MGNNSGKKQAEDSCPKNLDELFITISRKKSNILRSDLKKAWGSLIDPDLYNDIESYLFMANHNELTSQVFKKFFTDICKGSTDQKVDVLYKLLGSKDEISGSKLLRFLTSILNSILIIQENKVPKRFDLWKSRMSQQDRTESLKEYGTYFLNHLRKSPDDEFTRSDLECLLIQFDFFLHMVICRLYDTEAKHFYTHLLPKWKYGPVDAGRTLDQLSVLDLFKILFLNLELPIDFQNEWRLLFSSSVDGESFSRLSAQIVNKGPTLIVIKDKGNHIFGGFAPASWNFGPNFFGDSRSFMFTLRPKMNVFSATNFSENYQYLNVGQQTMPNGLGMGGGILDRVWFFGLWLDAEFGTGYCSESCSTYRNYKMMSATKDFQIAHLEVWGVGPPPPSPSELGERSVLDGNLEAKAILEMAGKTAYIKAFSQQRKTCFYEDSPKTKVSMSRNCSGMKTTLLRLLLSPLLSVILSTAILSLAWKRSQCSILFLIPKDVRTIEINSGIDSIQFGRTEMLYKGAGGKGEDSGLQKLSQRLPTTKLPLK